LGLQLDRGDPRLSEVASELGTSERTLRRRLAEAGTGYRALIDDVRRERALMLAHEGVHSVTAIAVQVGFADMTAFTRAFRRWTGSLPSDYLIEAKARTK
jgi:AraC-like DNA-binding protein